jgi:mono/diheme cytochrome c family protein
MIGVMFASVVFGGTGCNVVVANRGYVAHQAYAAPVYNQVAYTPSYNYTPYYTASALAYKVEDPERSALVRQNEKLTDALIHEVRANRERADRLEQSISAGGTDIPQPLAAPQAAAAAVLRKNCASCHSGEKAKGGFILTATPTLAQRLLVNEVVSKGEMPPKDKPALSNDERKVIAEWAVVTTSK